MTGKDSRNVPNDYIVYNTISVGKSQGKFILKPQASLSHNLSYTSINRSLFQDKTILTSFNIPRHPI